MENSNYNNERFDSYLNKIIIFSSKSYYKKQKNIMDKERTIVDDEDYDSFLQSFLMVNCAFSAIDKLENNSQLDTALQSLSAIEQSMIFLLFREELN